MPAGNKALAKSSIANQKALEWWRSYAARLGKVGGAVKGVQVICRPVDDPTGQPGYFAFRVGEVLACLTEMPAKSYSACLRQFEHYTREVRWLESNVEWTCVASGIGEAKGVEKRPGWDERTILDGHIVEYLIGAKAPPPWFIAALAATGGAAFLPSGAAPVPDMIRRLCIQTGPEHWSCPSFPVPGGTPQPDQGGQP
jgi:hypothetical protein